MTYKVPAVDPSERFDFEIDGTLHSVPLIEDLPLSRIEAMNALRGMTMSELSMRELVVTLFGEDAGAAVYELSAKRFQGLVEAWEEHSATTVGESKPSGT